MVISRPSKAILIFIILLLLIGALELPKIRFQARSAIFFISDPVIRFLGQFIGIFGDNQTAGSLGELNRTKMDYQRDDNQKILAYVLKIPPAVAFGNIVVSSGRREGVEVGMKAVIADDIFVGFVEEVFEHNSRIRLLSSFGKIEQVRIGKVGAVSLEGLGGSLAAIGLPRDIGLEVGEAIMIVLDQLYVAGFIESVDISGTRPLVEARVILPFNVYQLDYVFIVP